MHRLRIRFPRFFQVVYGAAVTASLTALSFGQRRSDQIDVRTMTTKDRLALESAVRHYQSGDTQAAEPVLQQILRRYPDNAEALESLGLIYADRNQVQRALPLLELACHVQPGSPIVSENLGITYLKLGRNVDAVRALQRAVTLQSDSRSEAMLGLALMRLKNYAEAALAFQSASEHDAKNRDNYYNWALALFMAGDLEQAARRLQSFSAADLNAQEQALLGDIREAEGRLSEAVDNYTTAARLDPSEENINALGLAFLRHSVYDGALLNYSEGLSRYPSSSRMMFGLALSKYGQNNFTGAAELLSRLLRSHPHDKVFLEMLGRSCELDMSDPGAACDEIIFYAKAHPGSAMAETSAAAAILQRSSHKQDLALVRSLLEGALAVNPRSVEANYLMGVWNQQQSLWQASIPFLQKALQINSGYGKAHYRMARAFFRLGRRADGEREIELTAQCNREEQNQADQEMKDVQPFLAQMH